MSEAIPSLPQYAFMAWCLVKAQGNFTFTFMLLEEGQAMVDLGTDGKVSLHFEPRN
jgi:hypothetical protein